MNVSITTRQAYSEVDEFLELIDERQRNEVPQQLRNLFKEEKDKTYIKGIRADVPIKNQKLKEETLAIIALLNLQYWCKDKEEQQRLRNIYINNEQKHQEVLKAKYNPDNMFKKTPIAPVDQVVEEKVPDQQGTQTVQMVEYKENFIKKFFNKIKGIFKKK